MAAVFRRHITEVMKISIRKPHIAIKNNDLLQTDPLSSLLLIGYLEYYMRTFVYNAARRIAAGLPSCVDSEDLEQIGFFGLRECIEKYDPALNFKFETYALVNGLKVPCVIIFEK